MPCIRFIARHFFALVLIVLASSCARAQITNVTDDTSTPIPGAGHDYIHLLNETVNPANGSVSLRINFPMPKGRGITLPFSFAYDSNGVHHLVPGVPPHLGQIFWTSNQSYLSQGGWSFSAPMINFTEFTVTAGSYPNTYNCNTWANYVFSDPTGGRHSLLIGTQLSNGAGPCQGPGAPARVGGDSEFEGILPNSYPDNTNPSNPAAGPVTAVSNDGTVYSFSTSAHTTLINGVYNGSTALALSVEDRNGNQIKLTDSGNGAFSYADTLRRTVVSTNGFGPSGTTNTVTVGGLAYQAVWKTAASNYTVGTNQIPVSGSTCINTPASDSESQTVISQIVLPNGQSYKFFYGTDNPNPAFQNPYGLLSEVDYPDGGSVKYTWGLPAGNGVADSQFNEIAIYPGQTSSGGSYPDGCLFQYQTPVVISRTVSFDGSSTALTQTFSYATAWSTTGTLNNPAGTTWTSKSSTVTTSDSMIGKSSQTSYSYSPVTLPLAPMTATNFPGQVPVELRVQYFDWSNITSPLRTVNKTWYDAYNLASQQTYLENGTTSSKIVYCYAGSNCTPPATLSQLIEKDEYDFGAASPTRKTLITYQGFTNTPGIIADRPCKVIVQDGSGNTFAETDFYYDGKTSLCSTVSSGVATGGLSGDSSHDSTTFGTTSTTPRGNATKVVKRCLQSCTDSTTTYTFDEAGSVLSKKDPCGNAACSDMTGSSHTTTYSYIDNFDTAPPQSTYAYLTQITDPLGHVSTFKYALSDGQLIQFQNQNDLNASRTGTSYLYNDSLRRLTETDYADGGKTIIAYSDTVPAPSVTTSRLVTSSPPVSVTTTAVMDGLGQVTQTELTSDPDGPTYTDTTYDGFGRVLTQSNPYRSKTEATYGVTTNYFDGIGRPCLVVPPDGTFPSGNGCPPTQPSNTIMTTYSLNATTVTDQAAKSRKSITDGLGRVSQVFEDPAGLNYETDYSYNVLDDLLCAAQKGNNSGSFSNCASTPASWRPRTFTYNSLSQLTQAMNPESGTVAYAYDTDGNLSTKTAPKPNQTGTATVVASYTYDVFDRTTQKSFNDGTTPTIKYGYDAVALTGCGATPPALTDSNPIGARTAMCDGAGAESWSHDSMGRVLGDQRVTNGVTYGFPQTYNLDGSVSSLNYGNYSGSDVVTFTPGGAGHPVSETGTVNSWTIISAAHYAPNGALCGLSYSGNNAAENVSFNNRFQPLHWHVTSTPWGGNQAPPPCQPPSWTAGWLDYVYNYVDSSGHNNGNVQSIFNNVSNYWSPNFTYDSLNRIATAQTNGTVSNGSWNCWAETYTIDPWGNLYQFGINTTTQSAYVGCSQESGLTTQANTNNQLINYGYDAAGNLISIPGVASYTYDAENHLVSTAGYTYSYDGDGKRVMKSSGSSGTLYWYGASSMPLFETSFAGGGNFSYYYFDGRITNRREFAHYYTPDTYIHDALGNTNLVSGYNGAWDWSEYYPFGGEWAHQSNVGNHYKFTGKERDPESNLDNFGARYDASSIGRFMSPDPLLNSGRPLDPQTWNRYAYARNNPLNIVDPTGLYDLTNNCRDDKKCKQHADDLKKGLKNLQNQVKNVKDPIQKARLKAALKAIGTEGDHNGVVVEFGKTQGGGAGETTPFSDPQTYKVTYTVTLDPNQNKSESEYAINGAHEGTHIDDLNTELANPGGTILSPFSLEYRGYQTSIFAASALGNSAFSAYNDNKKFELWNGSWAQVDKNITSFVTTFRDKNGKPDHPETTPHNPWPN